MSSAASPAGAYLPALDGLRAVSILLVVVSHLGAGHVVPGGLGVTIFFFISGFIITRLLLQDVHTRGSVDLGGFYVKRFFRLAPALGVYIALSAIAYAAIGKPLPPIDVTAAVFYAANYYHLFHGWGEGSGYPPLQILWSLAIEEHFYILFPLVVMALRRHVGGLLVLLAVVCAAVLAWRCWLVLGIGLDRIVPGRIYLSTDTRIDSIAFGCALSTLAAGSADGARSDSWRRVVAWLASRPALLLGAALMMLSLVYRDEAFRDTARYSVQGLAMLPLFATLFLGGTPGAWARPLSSRPMLWLGRVSYSLYLYDWLVVGLLGLVLAGRHPWQIRLLAVVLMLLLATASWRFIESPMRRLGHRWAQERNRCA
jgi:peptidoglycan/LPS O-acetylase OafA/YrhL